MAELDFVAIKARAQEAVALGKNEPGESARYVGQIGSDVLALLNYLDAYEKALKPLRGKTFTIMPGLEILNTVSGPTREQLQARIDELEAEVEKLESELFSANQRK